MTPRTKKEQTQQTITRQHNKQYQSIIFLITAIRTPLVRVEMCVIKQMCVDNTRFQTTITNTFQKTHSEDKFHNSNESKTHAKIRYNAIEPTNYTRLCV